MHGIANPKNREFKSHPLLHIRTHSRLGYQQLDAGAIRKSRHAYRKLETSVFLYGLIAYQELNTT